VAHIFHNTGFAKFRGMLQDKGVELRELLASPDCGAAKPRKFYLFAMVGAPGTLVVIDYGVDGFGIWRESPFIGFTDDVDSIVASANAGGREGEALAYAREACARKSEAEQAFHSAHLYRAGKWDDTGLMPAALLGARMAMGLK